MEELFELLKDVNDEIDYENVNNLVTGGYLTSLELLSIISELEDRFDIEIAATDIVPANFESVDVIWNMISAKKG